MNKCILGWILIGWPIAAFLITISFNVYKIDGIKGILAILGIFMKLLASVAILVFTIGSLYLGAVLLEHCIK